MGHEITSTDSLMSVREVPWHGLGNVVERPPRDIAEALDWSGLGWQVEQEPVYRSDVPGEADSTLRVGQHTLAPGYKFNVRADTDTVLGVVSEKYAVVQNVEAFQFLSELIGSELHFETAGSLQGGRRVFVVCRIEEVEHLEVGGDRATPYLNFFNQHDGGGAVSVLRTIIRTVCMNTWRGAERRATHKASIRHTGDPSNRLAEVRRELELSIDFAHQFKEFGDRLASQKIAEREVTRIAEELWPGEGTDRSQKSAQRRREAVMHLFIEGTTVGNAPGTKWCAANAFLEHVQWDSKVRSEGGRFIRHVDDPTGEAAKAVELVVAA